MTRAELERFWKRVVKTDTALAREYGVSQTGIYHVLRGNTWKGES